MASLELKVVLFLGIPSRFRLLHHTEPFTRKVVLNLLGGVKSRHPYSILRKITKVIGLAGKWILGVRQIHLAEVFIPYLICDGAGRTHRQCQQGGIPSLGESGQLIIVSVLIYLDLPFSFKNFAAVKTVQRHIVVGVGHKTNIPHQPRQYPLTRSIEVIVIEFVSFVSGLIQPKQLGGDLVVDALLQSIVVDAKLDEISIGITEYLAILPGEVACHICDPILIIQLVSGGIIQRITFPLAEGFPCFSGNL